MAQQLREGEADRAVAVESGGPRNRILAELPVLARRLLLAEASELTLAAGETLLPGGLTAAGACLFVETGLLSLRTAAGGADIAVEVGLVGGEGMLGLGVVLGRSARIHAATALTQCSAIAIDGQRLRRMFEHGAPLRSALLRYANLRLTESGKRAACHLQHSLAQRVAEWILCATDRLGANRIAITHRQLGELLGATRPGVTLAIQDLEGRQAIRAERSLISVRTRLVLAGLACGCISHLARDDGTFPAASLPAALSQKAVGAE